MNDEIKAVLIAFAIFCAMITLLVYCSAYSDMWHVSQGYEWVPYVDGHWEKR